MDFDTFTKSAWAEHGDDAQGVADRLSQGIDLVGEISQLPALAGLIVHVRGEHLGQWKEGIAELHALVAHDEFDIGHEAGRAVWRSIAVLEYCRDDAQAFESSLERGRSLADRPGESDRARVHAIIASTLAGQGRIEDCRAAFERALQLAEYGPEKGDPAALALAITGNNLACALEEKSDRSPGDVELMKLAASTGRRFWGIAGDWKNAERAEYRLAMTHIAAEEPAAALENAKACLAICAENDADACELFFGNEALARAHHAAGNPSEANEARARCAELVEEQEEGMKPYCESEMVKLDAHLGKE